MYADLCHDEPLWDSYTYCGKVRSGTDPVCSHDGRDGCVVRQSGFPGAEAIRKRHICLPVYPGLSEEQTHHVVTSLAETLRRVE